MKFIALMLGALSLYGASEFSVNRADYASEFSEGTTQTTVEKVTVVQKVRQVNKTSSKKKKAATKSRSKTKQSGYERAKNVYGKKVVEVATLDEAKKIAKSRKDLVVFDKVKGATVQSSLSSRFEKSELVIMLQVDKRADGEVIYNIYFFKRG